MQSCFAGDYLTGRSDSFSWWWWWWCCRNQLKYSSQMSTERLISKGTLQSHHSSSPEPIRIFDELPKGTILSVSRPDVSDIGPLRLSYTIQLEYKQFKWCLIKKASQVIFLHFALKKRAIVEEFQEKQEQVKDWLQHIGIGDQTTVVHDNDEPDDGAIPVHNEDNIKKRSIPTRAALSIIRPSIGRSTVSERAKVAMQNYLNHFLGNIDIVNSREVCKFLEVSKLSFSPEYGPKLKEDYVLVQHLSHIQRDDADANANAGCFLCCCCRNNWQKVWAVLKPGFLALLADPFCTKLLDIIVFDVLPSNGDKENQVLLVEEVKERNPLRYAFKVTCGDRSIKIRSTSKAKIRDWISAIYNAGQKPKEAWCNPHRFGSFAPQRGLTLTDDGSQAQWFVDGHVAFEAIASSIENAKSEIYVTGWWLCPELYLKRPFLANGASRLDALFKAKANEGVKIYILLYKEVQIALKINSLYSQKMLLDIHENIKVLRYPDHFAAGIYLWSHHEKIVVVDHQICFLGGLDLCFGRYDTIEHKVGDHPPFTWPGKDYYNPRESEPNSWVDTMTDELDRKKYPRMPWHDVHCALWGPPCRDVARHFVQRWNHAKRNKAPNEQTIPLLMPQQHMVLPHYMGRSQKLDIESNVTNGKFQSSFSYETPSQDIQFLLPQEANGILDSSNVNNKLNGLEKISHLDPSHDEHVSKIMETTTCSKDDLESLDHHDMGTSSGSEISDESTCERQEVSGSEISQIGPRRPCSCQVIRSVSHWSGGTSQTEDSIHKAYCSLIENAEKFVYIENQFFISGLSNDDIIENRVLEALYRRILRAHKEEKCFRVIIVIPLLPGFQGRLDDGGAATVRAIMHWQYRTISRGQNSILQNLNSLLGSKTHDYISFYGLRTHGRLGDDGPLVTSQVYVHSKVMIVDDRITLIGSSNINDRSLLGHRDSEIGVLIEDKEFVESTMNGESWSAGKFANSLRLSLWSEHLGLHGEEISRIRDPIADGTYKDLWLATARENSQIYQDVFSCIPNDSIHSRYAFRQSMNYWKEKLGHTTIDLGLAPEKLESSMNGSGVVSSMEILKGVRGFLVSFPLEFMSQEDLRPMFSETEFYTSPQVFY